jgi:hypothetical protein
MLCQAGSRPKDACSAMLLIGNRTSVYGLPRLLRPLTPAGSRPPFSVGQSLNPSLHHYRKAFASSRVLYQLRRSPPLRLGDSGGLRFAPPQRANPAYHVSQFAHIDGLRAPLYTGGYHTCVGRPLKPTQPDPRPLLGLEPLSRLSSALLRCVIPRLYLRYPYPPFPAVGAVCDSRSRRLLRA